MTRAVIGDGFRRRPFIGQLVDWNAISISGLLLFLWNADINNLYRLVFTRCCLLSPLYLFIVIVIWFFIIVFYYSDLLPRPFRLLFLFLIQKQRKMSDPKQIAEKIVQGKGQCLVSGQWPLWKKVSAIKMDSTRQQFKRQFKYLLKFITIIGWLATNRLLSVN